MQYGLNYSGTSYCPLKTKITKFPDGFLLNILFIKCWLIHCCSPRDNIFANINGKTELYALL